MTLDMAGDRKNDQGEATGRAGKNRTKAAKKQSQGQAGPKLELTWDGLTANERRVLKALVPAPGEHRKTLSISELAEATGWVRREGKNKANSWVRNQLRRLVRANLVEHAEKIKDGRYILTDYGKRQARSHLDQRAKPQKHAEPPVVEPQAMPEPVTF